MTPTDDRPTLAEILAACLAVQAIYAARDAAALAQAGAAGGPIASPPRSDCVPTAPALEPADP
jgi:hypothetical protein